MIASHNFSRRRISRHWDLWKSKQLWLQGLFRSKHNYSWYDFQKSSSRGHPDAKRDHLPHEVKTCLFRSKHNYSWFDFQNSSSWGHPDAERDHLPLGCKLEATSKGGIEPTRQVPAIRGWIRADRDRYQGVSRDPHLITQKHTSTRNTATGRSTSTKDLGANQSCLLVASSATLL